MHTIKRWAFGQCANDRRHQFYRAHTSKLYVFWSVLTGRTKCMRTRRMFVCNMNGIVFSQAGRQARYAVNPNEYARIDGGGVADGGFTVIVPICWHP